MDSGQPYQLVFENLANPEAKGRWEVGFAISDHGVQNISFVNSINTIKVNKSYDAYIFLYFIARRI